MKPINPTISIFAIITMLQAFGQATAIIICEILAGIYKYPTTKELSGAISVFVTVPLELVCVITAIKYGWVKLE